MATIIDGKEISRLLRETLANNIINAIHKYYRQPHLAVILVGDDVGSQSYVKGKEKACQEVGIKTSTTRLKADISEGELLMIIDSLNKDKDVDGILVQLPLPKHIDEKCILNSIHVDKDVDGFHVLNAGRLYNNSSYYFTLPCTPKGIMHLLDSYSIPIKGKNAVVIGRSNIVGLPVAKLLLDRDATVTVCHSKTQDLKAITSQADILIAAVGKPLFVTKEMVKEGAVVIDVGVNRDSNNKLCGDVDFDNVFDKVSYITKVPGGVGPMTITTLLWNTYELYLEHMRGAHQ